MHVDLSISTDVVNTPRVKQLSAAFQVPLGEKLSREWSIELPIEERDWSVGLIVGPSGSGKSQIAREIYGKESVDGELLWGKGAVIDDFGKELSIADITDVCSAVGFNTVPSWMRPFYTLSNGEQFRVSLARKMIESPNDQVVVVDEFSSVVDRQVAKIASNAVQKYIRRKNKQFVAVTCHYDVVDWLQPDWVLEPGTCAFRWRSLRQRPRIECEIRDIEWDQWKKFAPYHYLSADLIKSARCYGLYVAGECVCFLGVRPNPISHGVNRGIAIWAVSRIVTLPDWQGIGLAYHLLNTVAAAYRACNFRFRHYPGHPSYIASLSRDKAWRCVRSFGKFRRRNLGTGTIGTVGGGNSAIFEYEGPPMEDKFTAMKIARLIK